MDIREQVPLAPLTTIQVGGSARYFCELYNEEHLLALREFARQKSIPVFVLGGGSNIVVSDDGFPGLVIQNRITGIKEDGNTLVAGGGVSWDELVEFAVQKNLAGLEMLSGIPGTVGAAPVQNVGAYGVSMEHAFVSLRAFDLHTGEFREFTRSECGFGYRTSRFKTSDRGRYVILSVTFSLVPNGTPILTYHDLVKYFENKPSPSLAEVRRAVIEIRARKGMVIRPEYESYKSVGSFFKNPIVSKEVAHTTKEAVEAEREKSGCNDPWFWFQPDGRVKISAACLIERAGFSKGTREGEVGISPKQPLAILNYGAGKATDIKLFADKIQQNVQAKFGITLEQEAELIGF
jgi:UDP-N-acetylmuramate dehydrogenase